MAAAQRLANLDAPTCNPRVGASLRMDDPVAVLPGVSATRSRALERLGIRTIRDLLRHAPFRYMDFTNVTPAAMCAIGQKANVLGEVDAVSTRVVRRRMRITQASIVDDTGVVNAVWFNQPWIANAIAEGKTVLLQGTVEFRGGFRQMNSPEYMVLEDDATLGIRPVYKQTKGITSNLIAKLVAAALEYLGHPVDPLPVWMRLEHGLMSRHCAIETIHMPRCVDDVEEARRRLAYEELLVLQLHWMLERNEANAAMPGFAHVVDGPAMRRFEQSLPFELTHDQRAALDDILSDMAAGTRMNRMLLGDVGTGKTMVAAGAFAAVADSGAQGVMMAPTEVLAKQYGSKVGQVFDQCGMRWAVLTSSTPAADRKAIVDGLATGMIDVLFSTHAVLEDDVRFANLTLAVVDEQHRFGVAQREKLRSKGAGVDYLCMTATPIPRSLALTVYGNLDCSCIRQRPGGNRDIETVVMEKSNRFAAFDAIRECVAEGRQAYIICPLIGDASSGGKAGGGKAGGGRKDRGEDERDDLADEERDMPLDEADFAAMGEDLRAARKEADYLQNQVFPNMRVGLLCGEQGAAEKADVMARFAAGEIDVLVSTTVVEVGVDVPNATLMVVEDAERFGLSQLHQLRGRVGRGEHPGKAILLASTKTEVAAKRMEFIASTQDGFELAKMDLSLRKEGDVAGSRQHGVSALRFSNLVRDADLIDASRADAQRVLASDPLLVHPANALMRHEVDAIYSQSEEQA